MAEIINQINIGSNIGHETDHLIERIIFKEIGHCIYCR